MQIEWDVDNKQKRFIILNLYYINSLILYLFIWIINVILHLYK